MKNDKLDNIRNLIKTRYIIIISIVLGLMAGLKEMKDFGEISLRNIQSK